MGWREIKANARQTVHDTMGQPASFYVSVDQVDPPTYITARPHSKHGLIGDLSGTNLSYAESPDRVETIIFWRDQIVDAVGIMTGIPPRSALVVFSADEGYFIDNVRPPDGDTVTAEVVRADAGDLVGKTLPGDL